MSQRELFLGSQRKLDCHDRLAAFGLFGPFRKEANKQAIATRVEAIASRVPFAIGLEAIAFMTSAPWKDASLQEQQDLEMIVFVSLMGSLEIIRIPANHRRGNL